MTVKELFQQIDQKSFAKAFADREWEIEIDQTKNAEEKEEYRKDLADYIFEQVQKMLEISEKKNPKSIIFCHKSYDYEEENPEQMDVSLIHLDELLNKEIKYYDYDHPDQNENLSLEEQEAKYVILYAFDLSSWEDVLGWSVADASIQKYGAQEVAIAIYDEMTFFGYEPEAHEKNSEEELAILEERVKEVQEHPENCISFTIEELYERAGIPMPTPEEKAESERKRNKSWKKTQEEKNQILERIKKDYTK